MNASDNTVQKVAKKLRTIRRNLDLTQAQVADKAKMTVQYYSKIERGAVKPSIEAYERIAKALKVSASDIFPF